MWTDGEGYGRSRIHLVILMKDYQQANCFTAFRQELKDALQKQCSWTSECGLSIEAPDFVEVSLELCCMYRISERGISVRQRYLERITQYLEPGRGPGQGRSRSANFPTEEQIRMMLHGTRSRNAMWIGMPLRRPGGIRMSSLKCPFCKGGGESFAVGLQWTHQILCTRRTEDAE